jgi:hypothetical protein
MRRARYYRRGRVSIAAHNVLGKGQELHQVRGVVTKNLRWL